MRFGEFLWNDRNVPEGRIWLRVDLKTQMLSVFRGDHEIGTAVVLYGTDGKPTPAGLFPILERQKEHRSSLYDAEMPYMLRLTNDGVAIHASDVKQGSATHGCIGVPLPFARLLYSQAKRGDVVAILGAVEPSA
jgi:lipoprotein-anchoring transpeptidase ErfK/SrfK